MGKLLVNKIREINPLAKRGTLILLALLVSFACLTVSRNADAAVAALQNWKNTAGTNNTGTITGNRYFRGTTAVPGATNAFGAVSAGANRLMVVALAINTSVATNTLVPTVTYGGQALTVATTDQATSSRQHTWLFCLNNTGIAAAVGTNLSFTYTGNAGLTYTGTYANAAVYSGVDQGTPFQYQNTYNSGAAANLVVGPLATSQVVTTGDYAVEVVNTLNTAAATSPTVTLQGGWTSRGSTAATGTGWARRTQIAYRNTAGTWTSQHAVTIAASVVDSMSAMTLKQILIPGVVNGVTVPNLDVYAGDTDKVVDAFSVTGGGTMTGITITGNATTNSTNVSQVHVYRKGDANTTVYTSTKDTLVGTAVSNPVFPLTYNMNNEPIVNGANYIITYDVAPGAIGNGTSITLTGRVTAITPTGGALTDTAGATLTVLVTTAISDTTEPSAARVKNSSAPTLLDAFSVKHTGTSPTDDDNITDISVTLTPPYISGGSAATLSKIKKVEIVNAANTFVYGSSIATLSGDIWDIQLTTPILATATPTTYYVRISTADSIIPSINDPSGTSTGYYGVQGTVTGFMHSKSNNKAVIADTGSQTIAIDFEDPDNVPAFNALAPLITDTDGDLNLTWSSALDPHVGSLDAVKPYKVVRGAANGGVPNPHCIDGTDISLAGATINYAVGTATDHGLLSGQATQYKYRICTVDSLGNISSGMTTYGTAKVHSVCSNPPIIKLTPVSQIIKSTGTTYSVAIANMDTGVCSDVVFSLALVNEGGSNPTHFSKSFPATVTLGTGGAGRASTGANALVTIAATGTQAEIDARQLESYQFGIQVSSAGNSHGGPLSTATVSGLLNDMPSIVHNSANMNKFTYGGWGQTYTCATCHSNSTTNIKGVFQLISTPIGRRNVVFTKTSSVVSDYTGVLGNDQRPVKNVSNFVCSVCHHNTRQHQYSANKPLAGPGKDESYVSNHNNSTDCVVCHTHNSAFRSITGACGDCHGSALTAYAPVDQMTMVKNVTNALGPLPPNYGAHSRHANAKIGCATCHSNSNHGQLTGGWVGDNKLEMGFYIDKSTVNGFNPAKTVTGGTFYGTSNINFPFTWSAGASTTINTINEYTNSCNTYCHGSWTGNAGNGSQQQPIWVGDGNEIVCGSCHYATGTTPPQSGSHLKHSATTGNGLGIACTKCHGTYVSYTGAAHVNGKVEWDMTAAYPGAKYNGSVSGATTNLAGDSTFGQCSVLYCHSDVQSGNGTGVPTRYDTPTWGGTAACGTCHAQPNQSGSHKNHENAQVAFDCHVCHYNGGTTTPTNHANGYIDFQFVGLAQNTVYSLGSRVQAGTVFGKCNNSDCHGRFEKAWGTPLSTYTLCEKCHGSQTSAGGFYGTKGPGSSAFTNESGVGVHDIHIQNPNSPRKATFARFTSYAAAYSCKQCHFVPNGPFSPGHIDSPLPAESGFSHMSSIAHNGDTFGYYSTPNFNAATKACSNIWCHGAGMISNSNKDVVVNGTLVHYAGTTPAPRQNPQWNVPYLTGAGATDCTKCHAMPPAAPNATYTHFGKTLAVCKDCHQHVGPDGLSFKNKALHVDGKVDGGCAGCHGNPPINNIVGDANGLTTPAQNALSGGAGAHNAHQLLPQIGNNCNTCHNLSDPAMPSNQLEIGFNGLNGMVTSGTFTGYTNSVNGPKWSTASPGTTIVKSNVQAAVCSNLYCHGGGSATSTPPRPAIGGGINTTPDWEVPAVCGDCHGVDSANAPSGGSHQRHALTVSALSCASCHGDVADNGTHVKGSISWKLDLTNPSIGSLATYNNSSTGTLPGPVPRAKNTSSIAVGDDYRFCNNVYCHSTVQGANGTGAPTYGTPQWGKNGTMGCSSCHRDYAIDASPQAGSHPKHSNVSTGLGLSCGQCHHDGGDGTQLHADNYVYVNFSSTVSGTYNNGYAASPGKAAGSVAYSTCSATYCHGTAASPAWGTAGPLACNSCHNAKGNDPFWSVNTNGRHNTHYADSVLPTSFTNNSGNMSSNTVYRFTCGSCHKAGAGLAVHSKGIANANGAAQVFFGFSGNRRGTYIYGATQGNDNGFNWTNGDNCSTTYCHSNGRGGAPKVTAFNWASGTGVLNCTGCHDGKRTSNATPSTLSGKHDRHMNYSTNNLIGRGNGFNCVDCHARTITNVSNITLTGGNKSKHINKLVDYSGARANKGLNAANHECTNVYCHSNGNPNALIFVSMTGSKNWNTAMFTITTCNKCHGRSNALGYPDYANGGANTATSNLHAGHLAGMADTTACADCHRKTPDTLVASQFRPYSTLHLSGGPNVYFNTAKPYIGSKATATQATYLVTCSTVICHGQGAPVWGTTTAANTCQKCHGSRLQAFDTFSSAQVAPGYGADGTDTSMIKKNPTDPRVGAHQRHLATSAISGPIKCGECHVTVTSVRSANHWNYSTATLTFQSSRATQNHTPSVSRTGGIMQCSNVNCHSGYYNSGTTMAPFWNMTGLVKESGTTVGDCVKCHAMPPPAVPSHTGTTTVNTDALSTIVAKCQGCHSNVSSSATNVSNAFGNKALHVNGIIEVAQNCDGCHDYDTNGGTWGNVRNQNYGVGVEGRGAHYKHIEYLKAKTGLSLVPNGDTWASASYIAICGACHSTNPGTDHTTGTPANPRSITFGSGGHAFGPAPLYNGNSATSSSVNPKSCSNTDCHYRTSPIWSTY